MDGKESETKQLCMSVCRGAFRTGDMICHHIPFTLSAITITMGFDRWTSDIYTAEVTAQRKLRLEGDSHTKAAYELHRFLTRVNEDAADRAEEARRQAAGEEASRTPRRSRFRRKGQGVESSDAW